jgi:hypothetical protein
MQTQKYMRDFVKKCNDKRLLDFLEAIEGHVGYSIPAKATDYAVRCAVQYTREKKWVFLYKPNIEYLDEDIFHELMHICLAIEGWPLLMEGGYCYDSARNTVLSFWNLAQHMRIWERGKCCGFPEEEFWNDQITNEAIPLYESPDRVQLAYSRLAGHEEGWLLRHQVIQLAGALLSPARIGHKNHLRKLLIDSLPKPVFEQAASVYEVYAGLWQSFPRGLEAALEEVLKIIEAQLQHLQIDTVDNVDSNFYARIETLLSCHPEA